MQKLETTSILNEPIARFIISVDEVAHVQPENTLEHAFLVLIKSGYTAIPVLDIQFKLHGLISKAQILDAIIGLEKMEPERLQTMKVIDVMTTEIARMKDTQLFEKALSLSINHPFICVENDEGAFVGIVTRSKLLAYVNGYLHEQRKMNNHSS